MRTMTADQAALLAYAAFTTASEMYQDAHLYTLTTARAVYGTGTTAYGTYAWDGAMAADPVRGAPTSIEPYMLTLQYWSEAVDGMSSANATLRVTFSQDGRPKVYMDVDVYDTEAGQPCWDDRTIFWKGDREATVQEWVVVLNKAIEGMLDWIEEYGR